MHFSDLGDFADDCDFGDLAALPRGPYPTPLGLDYDSKGFTPIQPQRFRVESTPNHVKLAPNRVKTAVFYPLTDQFRGFAFGVS